MTRERPAVNEKPLHWVGSSLTDLAELPRVVQREVGRALSAAQFGGKHPKTKPWKGAGPGVFEIVSDERHSTYRAVYTVRFEKAVYVLHAFQKKSPAGIKTARRDIEIISRRLKRAREDYEVRYGEKNS
jgi:phage-related protein